ncbi:hypothetical protein H1W37_03605 [Stappia taiwanensis]|uniref:Uncharacterized protein n=1 Tax=Stappia taiwanensis TaxID=992267 RepID=A0A838XUI3_9HYPH|nr:hypothetical protein [Stappia taiwanensis]MBA4610724.1 hypothetical protein [Stappia taiwanensis]GGE82647.1 hypothetical protein GCM10007285_07740 [Stappia taiwanensis]
MPTPDPSRHPAAGSRTVAEKNTPKASGADWRCTRCDKLLGVRRDGQLHLRFARGHEYLVSLPAVATCRGCGTLNKASAPAH